MYFCSGSIASEQYRHYGLAAEIYTHFTSPIRRYADVMVHRMLAVSIGVDPIPENAKTKDAIDEIAEAREISRFTYLKRESDSERVVMRHHFCLK